MSIKNITTDELRRMSGKEGLVIQGCGGDLDQWLNGINNLFADEKLLLDGTRFSDCYAFKSGNITCLLFPFDDSVKLDMGKLAMWRIASHDRLGGTWLSDYVDNRLGGFVENNDIDETSAEAPKPDCPLIGSNGNVFAQIGIAALTLRRNGMSEQASEMTTRAYAAHNYDEALGIITEYVNPVSVDEYEKEDMDEDDDEDMDDEDTNVEDFGGDMTCDY